MIIGHGDVTGYTRNIASINGIIDIGLPTRDNIGQWRHTAEIIGEQTGGATPREQAAYHGLFEILPTLFIIRLRRQDEEHYGIGVLL